jgi:hypothetical protein
MVRSWNRRKLADGCSLEAFGAHGAGRPRHCVVDQMRSATELALTSIGGETHHLGATVIEDVRRWSRDPPALRAVR